MVFNISLHQRQIFWNKNSYITKKYFLCSFITKMFMVKRQQCILAIFALGAFWGCSSSLHVLPIELPQNAIENAVDTTAEDAVILSDAPLPARWWCLFEDDQLSEFIEKAICKNPTLQKTKERIFAAEYIALSARSSLFPYLSLGADVSRQKLSKTGVIPFASGPQGSDTPIISVPTVQRDDARIPQYFTLYETELNLKYHFDFWDKQKNIWRAALGRVQAAIAEEAFARLELSILVAKTYYKLQMNYRRKDVVEAFVANRKEYADIIQKRIEANIDNEIALQNAISNLIDAKDILLQIEGSIDLEEHKLKALMAGNFDEELFKENITASSLPRIPLPKDIHLNLIARRPDIIAQLWLIESASRQIAVAKADFYPDFNLTAFFGFQTIHFRELFKWPSTFFNINPAMSLPIFDAGQRIANLKGSEVSYDLEILEYNNLVINAAQEVLDALSLLKNSWQRFLEYESKHWHLKSLNRLTALRVLHNLNSNLDELISQGNVLMSEDQEVIALERAIQAMLDLIKSLGGGYDNCEV